MRVLLAYDGSAGAETARELIGHLRLPRGTEVAVAAAVEPAADLIGAPEVPVIPAGSEEADRRFLRELELGLWNVATSLRAPDRSCSTRLLRGRPGTVLVDEADAWAADLIVVGSRGHGPLETLLLGSVSAEVVDHAHCPVLVARHGRAHRLVIAVDGSQSAARAVQTVASWPLLHGLPATAVAEIGVEGTDERRLQLQGEVDRAVDTLRRAGMIVEGEVRSGDPADQVVKAARDHGADLLVVGTRGLAALQRLLLGSVARKVLLHTAASVLVVRPAKEAKREAELAVARATPVAPG
jgi:nucleotide-binding universal stress UspA family protein